MGMPIAECLVDVFVSAFPIAQHDPQITVDDRQKVRHIPEKPVERCFIHGGS
jgi:hypothetical protein